MSLISQCLKKPGTVSRLMIENLQRACLVRGCFTLYQLQRFTRLVPPQGLNSWVELLVSRLDGLGLDVTNPLWDAPTHSLLLTSEVVGSHFWDAYKTRPGRDERGLVSAYEWLPQPGGSACLAAVSKLAAHGIFFAAQLSMGQGLWCQRLVLPGNLPEGEYRALIDVLSSCCHQDRIVRERALVPGCRQLTLLESIERAGRPPVQPRDADSHPESLQQNAERIEDAARMQRACEDAVTTEPTSFSDFRPF